MATMRFVPFVLLALFLGLTGCHADSPVKPDPTVGPCGVGLTFALTSPGGAGGSIKIRTIVDGHDEWTDTYVLGADFIEIWLSYSQRQAGRHVLEIVIVEQPASPTTYTLERARVNYYEWNPANLNRCGGVSLTVPLQGQTATLATGERMTVPFQL